MSLAFLAVVAAAFRSSPAAAGTRVFARGPAPGAAGPRRLAPVLAPIFASFLAPVLALAFAAPAQARRDPQVLVLGRISDDPKAHYEQLKPLLDYVVPRMAPVGIREGRILMARDPQQMASYLRRGEVDWVTETAASGTILEQRAGAVPLLLTERNGVAAYRTVMFARRDSGIASLDDLRGRSVAFQNPSSTSAYFVPAMTILGRKLPLTVLLSPMDRPPPEGVGYLFARSELNIGAWVHKRLVDVGAMSDIDWNNPARMPPAYRRDLTVIHTSEPYPRALELIRGDLPPPVRARLREVLQQAANDPEGRRALRHFFGTTRFAPVDAAAAANLARLRQGVRRVREEVE